MFGSAITCTQGIYAAELQAIARALAMIPASVGIHVHSDSKSSMQAIAAYGEQRNERRRLRMAARPLLQIIDHLLHIRRAAGSSTSFSHVQAHTDSTELHSVGNRLADYRANQTRADPSRTFPSGLK